MANTIFKDKYSDYVINLTPNFKEASLYYLIREKPEYSQKIKNTYFKTFYLDKNKNNKFSFCIDFYIKYFKEKFELDIFKEVVSIFLADNLSKILINGYFDIDDIKNSYKKYDFKKAIKSLRNKIENRKTYELKVYNKISSSTLLIEAELEKYNKIIELDFAFIKQELFLDYTDDKNKINVNIEFLFLLFSDIKNLEIINENEKVFFIIGNEIYTIFMTNKSDYTEIVNTLKKFYEANLGIKLTISETFYLTILNKFKRKALNMDFIKEDFLDLQKGYIQRELSNLYTVQNKTFFSNTKFIYLWLNNIFFLKIFDMNSIYIEKTTYDLLKDKKEDLKTYDISQISTSIKIIKNIGDVLNEDYKIKTYLYFYSTGNLNKKNITYKYSEVKEYKSKNQFIKKGFFEVIEDFFDLGNNFENIYILLEPLALASKKFITSNIGSLERIFIDKSFLKAFEKYNKKYEGKFLDIDNFVTDFFEDNMEFYSFFSVIKEITKGQIGKKIPDTQELYYYGEKELFKRFLVYISKMGYVDILGDNIDKNITYYSGDGGWGYSYSLYEKTEKITIFQPKYIGFKDYKSNIQVISSDKYFSGNEIYLPLDTKSTVLEKISQFTTLEKIDSHIVLSISRDNLIKAKNDYKILSKDIFDVFKNLKLEIPKNIELLITGVDNQKVDVSILPAGIPIICDNIGIFNEFLKLKMFSDYILYSDEKMKLIIFSDRFRGFEKLLTKRKVIFENK